MGQGVLDFPDGLFTAVAAGMEHALAIGLDGSVMCWGNNNQGQCNVPSGAFVEIAGGGVHSIARRSDGTTVCWGWDSHDQLVPPGGSFTSITYGCWHSIGLRSNGELVHWGWSGPGGRLEDPRLAVTLQWRRVITILLALWIPPSPVQRI